MPFSRRALPHSPCVAVWLTENPLLPQAMSRKSISFARFGSLVPNPLNSARSLEQHLRRRSPRIHFRSFRWLRIPKAVTSAVGKQVGSDRGCFGQTSDPAVSNIYLEGELKGISFKGIGTCSTVKSEFPEPGMRVVRCSLDLSGLPAPYVGGLLTGNTIFSRKLLGTESDPVGYVQPSIVTIRLWKQPPVRAR